MNDKVKYAVLEVEVQEGGCDEEIHEKGLDLMTAFVKKRRHEIQDRNRGWGNSGYYVIVDEDNMTSATIESLALAEIEAEKEKADAEAWDGEE